jgi:hypothetical protein
MQSCPGCSLVLQVQSHCTCGRRSGRPRSALCQILIFTSGSTSSSLSSNNCLALTMSVFAPLYAARWLLLSVAFAAYVANQYRKNRRLQAFRGPFSTGWSEIWHMRAMLGRRSHLAYKEVNDKYGELRGVVVWCEEAQSHVRAKLAPGPSLTTPGRTHCQSRSKRFDHFIGRSAGAHERSALTIYSIDMV